LSEPTLEAVVRDLSLALDLFTGAVIVGDNFDCEDVRKAVEAVSRDRGIPCEACGAGWRFLRQAPVERRDGERVPR
jgi:hypothetical protein